MSIHERVTFSDGSRLRTVYLRDVEETRSDVYNTFLLRGTEVDREGSNVGRIRIIDVDVITRRTPLVLDLHYGELVQRTESDGEA